MMTVTIAHPEHSSRKPKALCRQDSAARAAWTSESEWITRLQAGDDQAFEELVLRYGARLFAVARHLLPRGEDAQDAVQEAFLAACRSIRSFRGECALSTWLHRIALNAALMKLRAARRHPEAPIEDLLPAFDTQGRHAAPIVGWQRTPEEAMLQSETRERVRDAIDRLPLAYRTVLLLRDIEELSTQETAAILEVSENAVKIRLHRARMALRTLLEPVFAGGPTRVVA
jgi:RNA polymerase sigma-70 factor (ECF subfamily)